MYTCGACALLPICAVLLERHAAECFTYRGPPGHIARAGLSSNQCIGALVSRPLRNSRSCVVFSGLKENDADTEGSNNADDIEQQIPLNPLDAQGDENAASSGKEPTREEMLKEYREAILNDGFDKQLTDLLIAQPDIPKDPRDSVPLSKFDWFQTDGPLDSDDEMFLREYCAEKVPDIDAIYKRVDPHGLRKYAPKNITTMEKTLGRVYDVNQPLLDEEAVNESRNTHTIPEPSPAGAVQDGETGAAAESASPSADVPNEGEVDEYGRRIPSIEEIALTDNDYAVSTTADDDANDEESDEFRECAPDNSYHDTLKDTVIEDDAYRYFVTLPMLSWTTFDKDALNTALTKLTNYNKNYKESQRQLGTSSPYTVFTSEPCSSVGVSDGTCEMSLAEELAAMETVQMNPIEMYMEEYKHSDLLNDIDAYEAAEYPRVVAQVCASDAKSPVFTMDDFTPKYAEVDTVDPRVYVSVPKSSIKQDKAGTLVLREQFLVKRARDVRLSSQVTDIPISSEPQIGTILIPNEFGYTDQNIRYLADEIGVISRSLVFVPEISDNDLVFSLTLNRLIKLMQTAFNVNRISLVALGSQGRRVVHYVYTAMRDTVERTLHDFKPVDPKLDPDRFRSMGNMGRLESILGRQKTLMLDDIISGIQRIEHNESVKAALSERDYNVIKPLSNLLQSIVLLDSVDVNFKEVAQLGIPVQFNMSNRTNLFDGLLRLDNPKLLSRKKKATGFDHKDSINLFDFAEAPLSPALQETLGEHVRLHYVGRNDSSEDKPDIYHMSTNHTGIDICLNFFPQASGHFYMKKPGAPKGELNSLGNAILSCADWIHSWSY
ncbi:5-nucleotidase, putative [Babesia ovata]|uniref:5-nucleotidase, putative n=1 Tax=Babesia ovata TaxID=189622 RepID=A0A2H6KID2_9APIC|nr:5-nucleotidase, putative [Babesia ovata]GBE62745.1 5-nucleotidase, putative [Babesia ovata]